VLDPRGLLLVSKRAAPDVYFLPGGKPEPGELPLACLRREIREELGVDVRAAQPFGGVRAPAALEPREMDMTVYLAELGGTPEPAAEIASLVWWSDASAVRLAPAVHDVVIPRLRTAGLL
jgi:8-oxo-dGTP diphosphatase